MFGYHALRTWEWDPKFAIRSVLPPFATTGIPFLLSKLVAGGTQLMLSHSPKTLIYSGKAFHHLLWPPSIWSGYPFLLFPWYWVRVLNCSRKPNTNEILRFWCLVSSRWPHILCICTRVTGVVSCHAHFPTQAFFKFLRSHIGRTVFRFTTPCDGWIKGTSLYLLTLLVY